MRYFMILCVCLYFGNTTLISQTTENPVWSENNIHLEAATGLASAYTTINYERLLLNSRSKKVQLLGKVGIGKFGVQTGSDGVGGLGALTFLAGKSNDHFEFTGGVVIGYDNDRGEESTFTLPILDLGYRYQKPTGGFILRVKVGILGFGMGVGYAF